METESMNGIQNTHSLCSMRNDNNKPLTIVNSVRPWSDSIKRYSFALDTLYYFEHIANSIAGMKSVQL